ncbi:MAG: DNA primase, partial [Microthrixaceae bacterium]
MGILDEDIGRVRDSTDIVAVISQYTQLKRVGQRWSGLCPFHNEKSPSFSVNSSEGLYHCFGCKASGDSITFLREKEGLDFVGAVELLASKAGITLRYTDQDEGEGRKLHARLFEVTEAATNWYHERLRTAPDAAAARSYLRGRGFTADEVAQYRIGWAPDGWDLMVKALKVSRQDLEGSGLGFENKAGRLQDFFRARILFPIMDERGRVIGFGGRKMPEAEGAKYQNSRDNQLYHKSKALYGLNWAKADAVNAGEIVICEGYTDVIGFARAGIPRAIATCGTALTEDHVKMLKRFTRRLVLAYDADDAGQAAADRVYAWEHTHDIEVSVVALPAGSDPDELARTSPEQLREAVSSARPFLDFRLDRVLAVADFRTAEARTRAADAALQVIAEHPDELIRDQYLMQVADTCRADAGLLRERLKKLRSQPRPQPTQGRARSGRFGDSDRTGGSRNVSQSESGSAQANNWSTGEPMPVEHSNDSTGQGSTELRGSDTSQRSTSIEAVRDGAETEALRLALQQPELVQAFLQPELFTHPVVRQAYELIGTQDSLAL